MAAFIGIDRLRRVDFDLTESPLTYITQALDGVREKLMRWKYDQIPTFGRPKSGVVNYSPDHAEQFDLAGNAIEVLDRAYRIGEVSLSISKRPVSSRELESLFLGGWERATANTTTQPTPPSPLSHLSHLCNEESNVDPLARADLSTHQ